MRGCQGVAKDQRIVTDIDMIAIAEFITRLGIDLLAVDKYPAVTVLIKNQDPSLSTFEESMVSRGQSILIE